MKYRGLVVGLGKIGMGYDYNDLGKTFIASHTKALQLHPDFLLVGGVDPIPKLREKFTDKYNQKAYKDLSYALEYCKPEMVIVSTPIKIHSHTFEQLLDCSSLKLILCEKPIAGTMDEAKSMLKKAKYKNIITPIIEPEPLGTGGAIKYVIQNTSIIHPFFVINGDSLSDINLDQMLKEFEIQNFTAMVGISRVKNAKRYGTVKEKNGQVLFFDEKSVNGNKNVNLLTNYDERALEIFRTNLKLIKESVKLFSAKLYVIKQPTLITSTTSKEDKKRCRYRLHGFGHDAHVDAFNQIYQIITEEIDEKYIIDLTEFSGIS